MREHCMKVGTQEGTSPCDQSLQLVPWWGVDMKGLVAGTCPTNSSHKAFWRASHRDLSQKFKLVWIYGTSPSDQRWSLQPDFEAKWPVHSMGHAAWGLVAGLVAGTSPFACADLIYFTPRPRKCSGQHNPCNMYACGRRMMGRLDVMPSKIPWLSCILIGCIFYGMVQNLVSSLHSWKSEANDVFTLYTSVPPSTKISSTVSVKGEVDNICTAAETLSQTWWAPQGGNLINNTQKIMSAINDLFKEKLSFSTGVAYISWAAGVKWSRVR